MCKRAPLWYSREKPECQRKREENVSSFVLGEWEVTCRVILTVNALSVSRLCTSPEEKEIGVVLHHCVRLAR